MTELLVVGACVAAFVALGAWTRRGEGLSEYVLAGRTLSWPAFTATLVPTFYSGALGIGEFTWTHGLSNWLVMAAPYYVFAALYAWLLAGRVRLAPGLTIPDHIESAYGRPLALVSALLVFLLACPSDELLMAGRLLSRLTGLPAPAAMLLAAAAALALLWRGGLRADVRANFLQVALMFGGFALILPFSLSAAGGVRGLIDKLPREHLSLTGGLPTPQVVTWWLIAVWTLVDPSFHQRCAAAEDPEAARQGLLASIACWALFDLMTTTAGLCARAGLPLLDDPVMAFPALADHVLPPFLRGLFYAGLCASLLAGLQGAALLAAVSLGKDAYARWRAAQEPAQERHVRWALGAGLGLAFLLALLLPSVVQLWYSVGSAVIPGLLLPMLGAYFPRWRVPPPWALAASLLAWLAASAWLTAGRILGRPPLGLEPMLAGLLVSAAVWLAAKALRRA